MLLTGLGVDPHPSWERSRRGSRGFLGSQSGLREESGMKSKKARHNHGGLSKKAAALAGLTVIGLLLAACGSSSGSSGSTASGSPAGAAKITLKVQDFGIFGYKDLYKQYMKRPPEHHGRRDRRGRPGQVQHPADPAHRRRLAAPATSSPSRRAQIVNFLQSAGQVREPPGVRQQRPQGQLAALEVRQRDHRRRQDHDRSRHRRRRPGHVLPQGPVREGRPADRPRRGRASSGRPGTTTSPPARSSRPAPRTRSRTSSTRPPTPTTRS